MVPEHRSTSATEKTEPAEFQMALSSRHWDARLRAGRLIARDGQVAFMCPEYQHCTYRCCDDAYSEWAGRLTVMLAVHNFKRSFEK